jgi:hypothetical protein
MAQAKAATTRDIVKKIAREFAEGWHQQDTKALWWEIHYRTGCSYGRALCYANDIRVGKIKPTPYQCEDCGGLGHRECDAMPIDGIRYR